ncbi:MAG TPA: hypothetical protein VKJ07_15865 [Mycobacteriales bacterium]|nr:hypothetical protein [Mycobacteriales bacterium]
MEVELPPGWLPLGPVPGVLLAAVATGRDGGAVATMVVRMHHCPDLTDRHDADVVLSALPPDDHDEGTVRDVRWCGPGTVAVLAACARPSIEGNRVEVTSDDLVAALRQTAVYAVDSTGNAISPSSAEAANDAWCGRTRTV